MDRINELSNDIKKELLSHITPFWLSLQDRENGGFIGVVKYDLTKEPEAERGVILMSRITWFFSSFYIAVKDGLITDDDMAPYGFSSEDIRKKESFRLKEGSEELMLGINSRVIDIMYIPELRNALVEDIRRTGADVQTLIDNERYTPNVRINVIYGNAGEFNNFVKECHNYLKE